MSLETLNPIGPHLARLEDGPDALPMGTPRVEKPYTGPNWDIGLGFGANHEIYRVRNMPHLYEDSMREAAEDHRAAYIESLNVALHVNLTGQERLLLAIAGEPLPGVWDWDCHTCKSAVVTAFLSDPCPNCGK